MTERESLSNNFSLYTRKYFIGPLLLIIAALIFIKAPGYMTLVGIIIAAIGVFYVLLKKVDFDEEFVYVGQNKFQFNQLTKLSSFDINMYSFPYIEINDNGRKRRIFTDSGEAGLLRIFLGILIPKLDPLKNVKRFSALYEASR
ncbi:MAG: hypothetical protein P8P74_08170 [Crocinitomicaceae bacterium]|nr:hypothetical protein [Crocinitomicaceae bacterium]